MVATACPTATGTQPAPSGRLTPCALITSCAGVAAATGAAGAVTATTAGPPSTIAPAIDPAVTCDGVGIRSRARARRIPRRTSAVLSSNHTNTTGIAPNAMIVPALIGPLAMMSARLGG